MPYEWRMRNVDVTINRSSVTPDAARGTPSRCIALSCMVLFITTAVAAQDAPRAGLRLETPTTAARSAVDAFLTAVDAERFQDAARWLDMDAFRQFFAQTVSS